MGTKHWIFFLMMGVFWLPAACGGSPEVVSIQPITQMVQVMPSATPMPTLTPTLMPTNTPHPTPTPRPTQTPSPVATQCVDGAKVSPTQTQVTEKRVRAGAIVSQTWTVENNGTCIWQGGYQLRLVSGNQVGVPQVLALDHAVKPGEFWAISMALTARSTTGTYETWWQMQNQANQFFGEFVYARLVVSQPTSGGGGGGSGGGGSSGGAEPNLGVLQLAAQLTGITPIGNKQCAISVFLNASGGTGVYSYYKDKDVEDPNFKIVDRHPGSYSYSFNVPNNWGGPVGFIVWSGVQHPQRATTSIWVDSGQTKCP